MKRKHATQHHSRELQSAVRRVAMREIPDSRLPLTDRCLFCSRCLDRGRRNRFPLFVLMDSSNMLPLRKASLTKRGLRLLWSNSKGFPHLTTTAQCLRRCQNTEQAWPPTFLPKPFFFYNAHLSADCHSEMLSTPAWSIVTFKKKKHWKKETSDHQRGWYRHLLPYMSRWEWFDQSLWFHFVSVKQKNRKTKSGDDMKTEELCRSRQECHLCARKTRTSGQQEQIPAPQHHR